MKADHVRFLVCPECKSALELSSPTRIENGQIESGELDCKQCNRSFPIIRHIPRFVPDENYADNFGFEWIKHARTQYDSSWGSNLSEKRFFEETKWPRNLDGECILEVGSGSGRFTEHAASTGAMVISMDYSYAVEANYASNGNKGNVMIVQADLYKMPFRERSFDKVICIGVLQHTPDVRKAFFNLPGYLRDGGDLVIDVYPISKGIIQLLKTKYWVRPFTRKMPQEALYKAICRYINFMWPVARLIGKLPGGRMINRALMIIVYPGQYEMNDGALKEWAILDTFDMLSPAYDNPQRIETIRKWFDEAQLDNIEVQYGYNGIEGRGKYNSPKKT